MIEVDNLSKQYHYVDLHGKKIPFFALDDISFTVENGEVLGVIGSNGSGKTTLLKVIAGITPPTRGTIKVHGKVSSLLSLGTGFATELTGRENIFLSGALLGMSRREINEKYRGIVEFSGVEQYIDTQLKYFSSGMSARLAFAIASTIEADNMLIDEALSVGDEMFRKTCLDRIHSITRQHGKTVVLVSHDMDSIRNLCDRAILLRQGKLFDIGTPNDVIDTYLKSVK